MPLLKDDPVNINIITMRSYKVYKVLTSKINLKAMISCFPDFYTFFCKF